MKGAADAPRVDRVAAMYDRRVIVKGLYWTVKP
jgi:hypothetical protein